jgi:hypothetical protein
MGGVGFSDSSRWLTRSAGGATAVGSWSTDPSAARAGGLAAEQWSAVEQCRAGQWEHSCDPRAETLLSVSAGTRSAAVAQCRGDWGIAPAPGAHDPIATTASRSATIRDGWRRLMVLSYPTPLSTATPLAMATYR